MAYRFKRKETVSAGVARILAELTDNTIDALRTDESGLDRGIHQARKNVKKSRSLLRLVRGELPGGRYQQADRRLRLMGRRLSGARDAKVMGDTLDLLLRCYPEQALGEQIDALKDELTGSVRSAEGAPLVIARRVDEVRDELAGWPAIKLGDRLDSDDFSVMARGFKVAYQRGRKVMKKAMCDVSAESFHDWRKRTKDHLYHTLLLRQAWPGVMKPRAAELDALAECLGDFNDLSVLQHFCEVERKLQHDKLFRALARLARKRQRVLRSRAIRLGRGLYDSRPTDLQAALASHWVRWKRK